jgi:hypothetical protein
MRWCTLFFLKGMLTGTRVRTSRARSNWQIGVGVKPDGETDRWKKSVGSRAFLPYYDEEAKKLKLAALQNFPPIHVTNNVHYISYLNDGGRYVPGDHFVERTLEALSSIRVLEAPKGTP